MKYAILLASMIAVLFSNCTGEKHFINDKDYRKQVEKQFEVRRQLAHNRDSMLFDVFNKPLTLKQKEALEFLYAYMPLSDLADYSGEYFLNQVDLSLQTLDTFNWGKEIPEDIFRHFVLPVRVNNENLDTARVVFFKELKDRVKNLSMVDAALEVNHWCHEKVNYRASDARTSSPLASVLNSFGRCGEESTFTVAAMRSVGIPARQVYTPRWAHTDDNHAWVEVFIDGKWQYLGACEPEAVLNRGWFDGPVKRAMMVHTNVIGKYSGSENVIEQKDLYTKINSLSAYTVTHPLIVKVLDKDNAPVEDAKVEFRIYNYAEFYPMVVNQSDKNGIAQLETGLGDLQVWVSKDNVYGYSHVSVGQVDTLIIKLNRSIGEAYTETVNNVPPVEKVVESLPVARQEENSRRLAIEDSIRNAYIATFMSPQEAEAFAIELDLDTAIVKKLISLSYGNWREIKAYMRHNSTRPLMTDLLESIAEKDLRDTPAEYLNDHLLNVNTFFTPAALADGTDNVTGLKEGGQIDNVVFMEGILSARVLNELIRPWRGFLQEKFDRAFATRAQADIRVVTNWVKDSITINTTDNYMGCPLSPIGVYELRIADIRSRNIFFVALCRSLFIPARIDKATFQPQIFKDGEWINISFEADEAPLKSARLELVNDNSNPLQPIYSVHYTLQKFDEGRFTTLDYEGSGSTEVFPVNFELEPGYYLLMTGHRRNDGSVAIRSHYFNLNNGDSLSLPLILQPVDQVVEVKGVIESGLMIPISLNKNVSLMELAGEQGLILAFINPANEPTRHVMSDIPQLKSDFEKWGGNMVFVVPASLNTKDYKPDNYKNMPALSKFAVDKDDKLLKSVMKSTAQKAMPALPYVMFVNTKGEITFLSSGYRIGIGENLLKAAR